MYRIKILRTSSKILLKIESNTESKYQVVGNLAYLKLLTIDKENGWEHSRSSTFPAWQISVILCQIISHIFYPDNEKAGTQTGLMYRILDQS